MADAMSHERLIGNELARAAEALLAEAGSDPLDPADAVRLATVQALLALYWELRHHHPETTIDPSLDWISALVCSGVPAVGRDSAG